MFKLPNNSRFRKTPIINYNNIDMFGRWPRQSWMDLPPSRTITIQQDFVGRLDLLSNKYFGTPDLWWVFMAYNNITDTSWPRSGDRVKIPRIDLVLGNI